MPRLNQEGNHSFDKGDRHNNDNNMALLNTLYPNAESVWSLRSNSSVQLHLIICTRRYKNIPFYEKGRQSFHLDRTITHFALENRLLHQKNDHYIYDAERANGIYGRKHASWGWKRGPISLLRAFFWPLRPFVLRHSFSWKMAFIFSTVDWPYPPYIANEKRARLRLCTSLQERNNWVWMCSLRTRTCVRSRFGDRELALSSWQCGN